MPRDICRFCAPCATVSFSAASEMSGLHHRPQDGQILHIFVQIVGFWGFKAPWMLVKAGVIYNVPKGIPSDLAQADSGMTIHMRAEIGLRVVQMESHNLIGADQRIHFADSRIPAFGGAD